MPDPTAIAGVPLPDGQVPPGTVTVRVVRERMGNNVAGQEVTLTVGKDKRTMKTDDQGRAQYSGLPSGVTVQATATVDGEALTSQEFPVPDRGGVRVALIAGIAKAKAAEQAANDAAAKEPARPGIVEIGPESRIIIEYQDDNLTVFYLLEVINNANGRSFVSERLVPERVLSGAWPRTFRLALLDKDVAIARDLARTEGIDAPMMDCVSELLRQAHAELGEEADHDRAEERARRH